MTVQEQLMELTDWIASTELELKDLRVLLTEMRSEVRRLTGHVQVLRGQLNHLDPNRHGDRLLFEVQLNQLLSQAARTELQVQKLFPLSKAKSEQAQRRSQTTNVG